MHRDEIEAYLRDTFDVHRTVKQIAIKIMFSVEEEVVFVTTIRDCTTRECFLEGLLGSICKLHCKEMLAGTAVLTGKVVELSRPTKIKKASRPRRGKQSKDEKNFKDLVTALFGANPGHCAEGEWTASASDIMREPGYLTKFDAERALVEKVLGSRHFLITPCTFLCPFESAVCSKGRRRLNRFGGISQMFKHWKARHGDNPAAQQLIARFKAILNNKRMTIPRLDAVAPLVQLEEEGYEQLRRPETVPSEDMFTFDFQMYSVEHREWLDKVGTI